MAFIGIVLTTFYDFTAFVSFIASIASAEVEEHLFGFMLFLVAGFTCFYLKSTL